MAEAAAHPGASTRLAAFDLMRWAAIAMVIAIHASSLFTPRPIGSALWAMNRSVQAAVPAFVFITGALLWSRYHERGVRAYLFFARKRLLTVAVPYVLWSFVYRYLHTPRGLPALLTFRWWAQLGQALLTGKAYFHLYFVPLILVIYAVTPLAARLARRSPGLTFAASVALTAVLWPATHGVASEWRWLVQAITLSPFAFGGAWYRLSWEGGRPLSGRLWPFALVAGLAGALLYPLPEPTWQAAAGASLPLIAQRLAVLGIQGLAVFGIVEGCAFAVDRWTRLGQAVSHHGPLVFGVYLVHFEIALRLQRLASPAIAAAGNPPVAAAVLVAVTTLVASAAAAWLLTRSRWTAWAMGAHAHVLHVHSHARG